MSDFSELYQLIHNGVSEFSELYQLIHNVDEAIRHQQYYQNELCMELARLHDDHGFSVAELTVRYNRQASVYGIPERSPGQVYLLVRAGRHLRQAGHKRMTEENAA